MFFIFTRTKEKKKTKERNFRVYYFYFQIFQFSLLSNEKKEKKRKKENSKYEGKKTERERELVSTAKNLLLALISDTRKFQERERESPLFLESSGLGLVRTPPLLYINATGRLVNKLSLVISTRGRIDQNQLHT